MDFLVTGNEWTPSGEVQNISLVHRSSGLTIAFFNGSPCVLAEAAHSAVSVYAIGPGAAHPELKRIAEKFVNDDGAANTRELVRQSKEVQASFLLFISRSDTDTLIITGDVFGSIPFYQSQGPRPASVSSVPELLVSSWDDPFDPCSYHDMVINERICFPYTAYKGITQVSPTCYATVSRGEIVSEEAGWRAPSLHPHDLSEFTLNALCSVLQAGCKDRLIQVALSGGLDSRILLSLVKRYTSTVEAFSVTQGPSRDAAIAGLVAAHRNIPHREYQFGPRDFEGLGLVMASLTGGQNRWYHGHLLPVLASVSSPNSRMLGGYGSNTNFSNYDSFKQVLNRIRQSDLADVYADELVQRWQSHLNYVEKRFDGDGNRLATAWPCTNKRAFAYYQVNRRKAMPIEPFMVMHSMFASKSMPDSLRPKVAEDIFKAVCSDELQIPVTQPNHPLGIFCEKDPTATLPDAGWPKKAKMLPSYVSVPPCLEKLATERSPYRSQLAAVYYLYQNL